MTEHADTNAPTQAALDDVPGAEPTDSELVEDITRDENGLTPTERGRWRAHYHAISTLVELAIAEAPTPDEARRRVALLRLDLRTSSAAIDLTAAKWTTD